MTFFAAIPAFAGVVSFQVDKDIGLTVSKEKPPVAAPPNWPIAVADALGSLIPESKMTCVKDVLANTFFARTDSSGIDDVWKSNSSVKAYNQLRLSRSPCLAVLTEKYYRDINKIKPQDYSAPDRLKEGRPALNARLGQGSFKEQKPGFALESAMKFARGNRAVALAMIGHCGHDEIENSVPTVVDFSKSPESASVVSAYLRAQLSKRSEKEQQSKGSVLNQLIETVSKKGNAGLKINCPHKASSFYAPGALGAEVDIGDDLKKKIATLQAPKKGPGVLPAKGYHTSFAAVMGCRLGACGMTEDGAAKLLSKIANMYRGRRQSATVARYENVRLMIEERFGINWQDTRGLQKEGPAIAAWLESDEGRSQIVKAGGEEFFAQNRARMNWDTWRKNIDAAILTRSGPAGEVWNAPPISEGRDPYFQDGTGIRPQQSFCPGWPEERCATARERRDTWRTDFDWTEGQQTVGGKFGAKFCQGQPTRDEEIEKQACQALQRVDGASGAIETEPAPSTSETGTD